MRLTGTTNHVRLDGGSAGEGRGVARLFEMTSDLLATISLDGRLVLLNPAWEQLLGWSLQELQGQPIGAFLHPDDVGQMRTLLHTGAGADIGEPPHAGELENFSNRFRHADGSWRWLLWSLRCDGDTWYAAAKDVTDRMWLERQALHDPLTRLPNRLLLMDRTRQALARVHRSAGAVALLFIDLDRFKAVNDNLGHEAGDRLLEAIAGRLSDLMRDSDTVARLGGDEFVILAEDVDGEEEALALGARVLEALEDPIRVGSSEISMLASVGISVSHSSETDPDVMLREADIAMYHAKSTGRNHLRLFDESLRAKVSSHVEIEERLRAALPRHELTLAYQPIVPLAGGRAVGIEALVRWHAAGVEPSVDGEVLPATFLPSAEGSELIAQIGSWVLHTALEQAAIWRQSGVAIPVSVNVSARELTEVDLAARIRNVLAYCRLPGRALCLDVSEEAVMRDPERARAALRDVRKLGVAVALDKFASGPSLALPVNLPLDILKLDRGLVATFDRDKDRRALFAATIALAKEAGLSTIAVGIENNRQLALARELECSVGQGFLLHQPTKPDALQLTGPNGSVTSAPWRPMVRLGGIEPRR